MSQLDCCFCFCVFELLPAPCLWSLDPVNGSKFWMVEKCSLMLQMMMDLLPLAGNTQVLFPVQPPDGASY